MSLQVENLEHNMAKLTIDSISRRSRKGTSGSLFKAA